MAEINEMSEMEVVFQMVRDNIFSQFLDSDEAKEGLELGLTMLMFMA